MQSPLKMGELMHSPMKIQHLTLPEETREQLMQSPLKMGELMHSPMKIQHLTLPEETRPTQTSLDQKICLVPDLGLGDLGLTWLRRGSIFGDRSEAIGSCSDVIGSCSGVIGSCSEIIGSCSGIIGSCSERKLLCKRLLPF